MYLQDLEKVIDQIIQDNPLGTGAKFSDFAEHYNYDSNPIILYKGIKLTKSESRLVFALVIYQKLKQDEYISGETLGGALFGGICLDSHELKESNQNSLNVLVSNARKRMNDSQKNIIQTEKRGRSNKGYRINLDEISNFTIYH